MRFFQYDSFLQSTDTDLDSAQCGHVGLVLRRIREFKGISQSELARKPVINLSYVCSIENHPSNLSIKKLMQICNALGIGSDVVVRILEQDAARTALRRKLSDHWMRHSAELCQTGLPIIPSAEKHRAGAAALSVADAPTATPTSQPDATDRPVHT